MVRVLSELRAQSKTPGLAGWRGTCVGKAKVQRCRHKKPRLVMAVKTRLWVDEVRFYRSELCVAWSRNSEL